MSANLLSKHVSRSLGYSLLVLILLNALWFIAVLIGEYGDLRATVGEIHQGLGWVVHYNLILILPVVCFVFLIALIISYCADRG